MSGIFRALGNFFLDVVETVVVALSIFLIVYLFLMQPHQVNGQSMHPSFKDGEYLLTDKISYRFKTPQRGDVVVFKAPPAAQCPKGAGCDFIKRIIGLPGETVEVLNNQILINGQPLTEAYIGSGVITQAGAYTQNGPVKVPEGSYMVMGDNRPHSSDSRAWGPVSEDLIVGKVFFRYWPPAAIGTISHGTYQHLVIPAVNNN